MDHYKRLFKAAVAGLEKLEAQLPEGMEDCTIRLVECGRGHTRLLADNWVDHGCPQCQIEVQARLINYYKQRLGDCNAT